MITAYEVCRQVGLEPEEYDEDADVKAQIDRIIGVAAWTLRGAIGGTPESGTEGEEGYVEGDGLEDDPRAEQLMLQMACDAWESRGTTVERTTQKVWASLSRFSADLMTQLRCDYGYGDGNVPYVPPVPPSDPDDSDSESCGDGNAG